jgi:hypothetical protein
MIMNNVVEIFDGEEWIPATPELFRAWTGLRRIFGMEFHGPVWNFGTDPESTPEAQPYAGARVCTCSECQKHVAPQLRLN